MSQYTQLNCCYCKSTFYRKTKDVNFFAKRNKTNKVYCSLKCKTTDSRVIQDTVCTNCKKVFKPRQKLYCKFCSQSCAAIYNNKNKKYGTRRSKLEIYLENEIKINFPNLKLECNDKNVIGSELDFYFPDLKLAIEINGIVHYEPIYGKDKFERIIDNDKQKIISCNNKGIELIVINTSNVSYLTKERKSEIFKEIFNIVNDCMARETGFEPMP